MECPSCRADIPEGNRFCDACGAPVPTLCPICGAPNRPGANFCGTCGSTLVATSAPAAPPAPSPQAAPSIASAERRQLTVMFCDLVGSTALALRLDPEDLREIIAAYHRCVAGTAKRFDGFVAKYMGDGALIYFGYPHAHEDDAERAVRAGLALIGAVGQLQASEPLRVHIGIATGLVVVGDLVGSGDAQERAVVGETPNLAARLQDLAEPDSVVIADTTYRLAGGHFEYADLGAVEAKGFAAPVRAWRVLREGATEGRFEALHSAVPLTPLVGRAEELELLLRRWQQARAGDGQVVLLSAEPGIGKSRLIAAVLKRLQGEPHVALRYFCSPHHQDSALHPIIAQLERAAGLARDDAPEMRLQKLEALLTPIGSSDEDVALLAALLSIPTGGRYPAPNLTPQRQKERTFEALLRQIAILARQQPVLMSFEDAHWIDPTSLELLDFTVERVPYSPVLLLVAFRPEFQSPWAGQAHVTTLMLDRLDRTESAVLVQRIAGNKQLPRDVVEEIAERTDGVPLFIEELTKAVLESKGGDATTAALSGASSAVCSVPPTLHASLMARLDRLGPAAKEVAQIGATIGRSFTEKMIRALTNLSHNALEMALDRLVASGLVLRNSTEGQATYTFKHALVRDAAYGTLLKSRRRLLHTHVATILERDLRQVDFEPEVLAYHWTQAGRVYEAVRYRLKAGQLALRRSTTAEAIAHLTQGLHLLAGMPDTAQHQHLELDLQLSLGNALGTAQGTGAPAAAQAYQRAVDLSERTKETSRLFSALYGLTVFHFSRAELGLALELAERALAAAERENDAAGQLAGHFAVGRGNLALGRLSAAQRHLEHALALREARRQPSLSETFYLDFWVTSLVYLAWVLLIRGYADQARRRSREALTEARKLAHPLTQAVVLDRGAALCEMCGDTAAAAELARAMMVLGREQEFSTYVLKGQFELGWAMVVDGKVAEGIMRMEQALANLQTKGDEDFAGRYAALLARAYARRGRISKAQELVRVAFERTNRSGERLFHAELHRIEGELLLSAGAPDESRAETCFGAALAVAQSLGARLWELRAATSLSLLQYKQGRYAEARAVLAPVHESFVEGFDIPQLTTARAVLNGLEAALRGTPLRAADGLLDRGFP